MGALSVLPATEMTEVSLLTSTAPIFVLGIHAATIATVISAEVRLSETVLTNLQAKLVVVRSTLLHLSSPVASCSLSG